MGLHVFPIPMAIQFLTAWVHIPVAFNRVMHAALVAQMVKSLLAMRETRVWSLGQKNPLEEELATHSSFLAWEIPWTEEPGGL